VGELSLYALSSRGQVPSELDPASRQPLLALGRLIYAEAN
jgi:hypothetical protein